MASQVHHTAKQEPRPKGSPTRTIYQATKKQPTTRSLHGLPIPHDHKGF